MRAASLAIFTAIAASRLLAVGAGGVQVQVGSLDLEAEWTGAGSTDGTFTPLDHPMGITVDEQGRVLVADSGNARIVVFDTGGDVLETWPLPAGTRPVSIAARADGSVLVADFTGDRILVLDRHGEIRATWGSNGSGKAEFQAPSGVAITATGTVIVVEFMGQRVQELDAGGHFLRFIDGGESGRRHAAERSPTAGMDMAAMERMAGMGAGNPHGLFQFPSDVAIAPDGTLYVSNTHAYEILVFDPSGKLRDAWGSKGPAAGEWEVPVGMSTDAAGNLYVADSANFRVQIIDPSGRPLLVSRADERWWLTTRRIYSPTDVAVGPGGRLYVADFAASKIQRFRVRLQAIR